MRDERGDWDKRYKYGSVDTVEQADEGATKSDAVDGRSMRKPRMMQAFAAFLAVTAVFAVLSMVLFRHSRAEVPPRTDDRLVFVDDFDFIDESKWTIEKTLSGGGNWEFQYYTNSSSNIFTKNGVLHMKPGFFVDLPPMSTVAGSNTLYSAEDVMLGTCEPLPECATFVVPGCTDARFKGCSRTGNATDGSIINPITSAKVFSKSKFDMKYGRIEWKAKLPRGDWLWPALWMLPTDDKYGEWPASGEIDIMESRGNNRSYAIDDEPSGYDAFGSTLHFGALRKLPKNKGVIVADGWKNAHTNAVASALNRKWEDFTQDWFIYGLVWTEDQMYTYVMADGSDKEHVVLDLRSGFGRGFYYPSLGMAGKPGWERNPYEGAALNAPFDQKFFLIMNLAVGGHAGNLGYWENAPWGQCYPPDCSKEGKFWADRADWQPSWTAAGEDVAFQIDWVKVWQ